MLEEKRGLPHLRKESVPLTDLVEIFDERIDPRALEDVTMAHYSIPAYDSGSVDVVDCQEINSVKSIIPENCLLISRLNPHIYRVWKVGAHPESVEMAVGSTEWAVLKPNNPKNLDFLHAVLHLYGFKFQFQSMVTGTTNSHQRIPRKDVEKLMIPKLENSRMEEIGSVFRTIQEASKSDSDSGKLQNLVAEVFRSIFLFDALGFGSYELQDPETIPDGWELTTLGEVCEVKRGLSYQGKDLAEEGAAMFNLNSFRRGGGYKPTGLKHYTGKYSQRHECSASDILIANTDLSHNLDLIGRPIRVPGDVEGKCLFSHHLFRIRINEGAGIHPGYLHHWLEAYQPAIARWASGSTVNMLPPASLTRLPLLIPPMEMMDEFGKIAEMALELEARRRMVSNRAENMIQPLLASIL